MGPYTQILIHYFVGMRANSRNDICYHRLAETICILFCSFHFFSGPPLVLFLFGSIVPCSLSAGRNRPGATGLIGMHGISCGQYVAIWFYLIQQLYFYRFKDIIW